MRLHDRAAAIVLAVVCAVAVASPAAAATYELSGTQVAVDEQNGLFLNHGDLLGVWQVTAFNPVETSPLLHAARRSTGASTSTTTVTATRSQPAL